MNESRDRAGCVDETSKDVHKKHCQEQKTFQNFTRRFFYRGERNWWNFGVAMGILTSRGDFSRSFGEES